MNVVKWLVLGIALSLTHPAWSLEIVSSFPQVGTRPDLPESISKAPSGSSRWRKVCIASDLDALGRFPLT
jgi:hypothetical protein